MQRVKLNIKGLSYSQTQSGAYALILGEEDGGRKLPIIIGGFEAQSIAIALEDEVNPPRPLTHDLFKTFADRFEINLTEVVIHKLKDGVFYSSLICNKDGKEEIIDARTSDAVALAIRFGSPIYTYENILQKAGIILDDDVSAKKQQATAQTKSTTPSTATSKSKPSTTDLKSKTIKALEKLMEQAVAKEDYELAARIRDEIDKREQK